METIFKIDLSFLFFNNYPLPSLPPGGKEHTHFPLPCSAAFVGRRSTSATEGRSGYAKAQGENERGFFFKK